MAVSHRDDSFHQGFLCVFSLVEQATFDHMDDFKEQISRVHEGKKMPIMLIGNKSDMEAEREVSRADAEAKAAAVSGLFEMTLSLLHVDGDGSGAFLIWRLQPSSK